ncbi:helix-turn-helix domain-containing protein [Novosphingobium sp.]|uniref:helix-turn-helix domain-containing protein n=1 Tax=Novosphingobium sp. TaxID=1874826 RepID=UPI003D0D542F
MSTAAIPTFALYGEDDWQSPAGFAHIETIAARSVLHDWAIAPHRHDRAVQLLLLHAGPAHVSLDGMVLPLTGPAYIVVPTGVVHGFRFDPHTVGHVLTLTQDFAHRARAAGDPLAALLARGGHGTPARDVAARARRLADELIALGDDGAHSGGIDDPLFDALAEALLRSLIAADAAAPAGDKRLAVFRHLVESHLAEHRSLAFYAHSVGTTVRTLTRLSQRHLGHSPQMLINRRLALEAQRLLRFTGASASAVASELGFADPSYFSRFYLRMTGRRPHDERKNDKPPPG